MIAAARLAMVLVSSLGLVGCLQADADPTTTGLPACTDGDDDNGSASSPFTTNADDESDGDGEAEDESEDGGSDCDLDAIEASVIAFCEAQAAGKYEPGPGESGAPCSSGDACDGICFDDIPYDGAGFCGDFCSSDASCPIGYECTSNAGDSNACQEAFCDVSFDAAECIAQYLDQADVACTVGCADQFADAIECLVPAAPLCAIEDAEDCGTSVGLLDACCDTACHV
jgi:hypothetical protein